MKFTSRACNLYFAGFLILYTIVMFISFGCTSVKYLPSPTITVRDSVAYHDTTVLVQSTSITIPGDTVKLTDTVPCPDAVWRGTATSKNGRTSVKASLNKGLLTVDCKTDSLLKQLDSLRAVIKVKELYHAKETVLPPVVEHDRYIPWWVYAIIVVCALIAVLSLVKGIL